MIVWREKFVAFAIHFGATLALGACAAALIFLVWFPAPLATMIGGTELFMLVVGCDLALGPLLSLVVYNSRKSRFKLVFDYVVIGLLQVGAMSYGVYIVSGTRPVYIANVGDRIEIVSARDIAEKELADARDPRYASLPITGPKLVYIDVPAAEHDDAMFESLNGNEEHMRPRYYVPYERGLEALRKNVKTVEQLEKKFPKSTPLIEDALRSIDVPRDRVGTLPVHHRLGFWTVLVDTTTGKPLAWVDFDPYG